MKLFKRQLQLAASVPVHSTMLEFIFLIQNSSLTLRYMGSGFQTFSRMVTDMSDTRWPGPLKWAPTAFSKLGPVFPSVPVTLTRCWYIRVLNSDSVLYILITRPEVCKVKPKVLFKSTHCELLLST